MMCIYIYVCMCVYLHVYIGVYMCVCTYMCVYICIYLCVCLRMHVCVYTHVYMCVYIYVHVNLWCIHTCFLKRQKKRCSAIEYLAVPVPVSGDPVCKGMGIKCWLWFVPRHALALEVALDTAVGGPSPALSVSCRPSRASPELPGRAGGASASGCSSLLPGSAALSRAWAVVGGRALRRVREHLAGWDR